METGDIENSLGPGPTHPEMIAVINIRVANNIRYLFIWEPRKTTHGIVPLYVVNIRIPYRLTSYAGLLYKKDLIAKLFTMARNRNISYKDSGVDIDAGDHFVDLIKPIVRQTFGPQVLGHLGGFAGLLQLDGRLELFRRGRKDPVLVACTDGVGSKILLAGESGKYHTIGIDLVAMSVNDMITVGAEPLIFLDYLAVNKLQPELAARVVQGIANGCREAGCALIGGETAELPDIYRPGDFDLAGFAVGIVDRSRITDGSQIEPGDLLIGLPSSGLHSNGYSLARRLVFKEAGLKYESFVPQIDGPVGDELLKPTRIYVRPVLSVLQRYRVKRIIRGMAHITGGGLTDNIARVLPKGCLADIDPKAWEVPAIFNMIRERGHIENHEMMRTFNNGIGMVLIVPHQDEEEIMFRLKGLNEKAFVIGEIKPRQRKKKSICFKTV